MTKTFTTELCHLIRVQTPPAHVDRLLAALQPIDAMKWGDYDRVSFTSTPGTQRFRTLSGARNRATEDVASVGCVELSFVIGPDADLRAVLSALTAAHAYEEPVILVTQALRTLHIRGSDEDNPARFWNQPDEDWLPNQHRTPT